MSGASSADIVLRALDALEAALCASTKDDAVAATRSSLGDLDAEDAARVASALASEWAWSKRESARLVRWIEAVRLEVMFSASPSEGDRREAH